MMTKRMRIRKIVSHILLFAMVMYNIVFNVGIVHGLSKAKVTITNIYTKDAIFKRTEKRITIDDSSIRDYENKVIKIYEQYEGIKTLSNIREAGNRVEADLNPSWIIKDAFVEGYINDDNGNRRRESKEYLNIGEAGIPVISNAESYSVNAGDPIVLNISSGNPDVLLEDDYTITVNGVEAEVEILSEKQIQLLEPMGKSFGTGLARIEIVKSEEKADYTLEAVSLYIDVVNIVGDLSLDGVTMFPTMGEPGSKVSFTRSSFPNSQYDIYFIKDLNNPEFTVNNMVKNLSMNVPTSGDAVITGEVPNLSSGPYYVVFTNANSQKNGVESLYLLPQQYQVITISQKPIIDSIYPSSAPAGTPTRVTINGNYFVNHNVPSFKPKENEPIIISPKGGDQEVTIDYGEGTLGLPNKEGTIENYKVNVKRKIEVDIGKILEFEEGGFIYTPGDVRDSDTFIVKTGTLAIDDTQVEDVIIRVRTIITGEFNATMVQEVTVKNGFTYYPATEKPNVDEVIPNIIPIENINNKYYIHSRIGRLLLTIKGSNFLVTRYEDNGVEKIMYPKITLGGTVINPNENRTQSEYKPVKFEVLKSGNIVDGTTSNEIGDTIVIELETGINGFNIANKESRILSIVNPYRQSNSYSIEVQFTDLVKFAEINANDFPVIYSVRPSLVSMDGGEEVTIIGSNFRPGAKVYIGNTLVQNINISGDMKKITFKAPKGERPGDTLLYVINPEGGIATHVFTYTETYTQPKLNYINPKEGTMNTLVTVKGENFLSPDPTVVINDINQVEQNLIYRLIGTRVFMNGYDINEYNMGSQNRIQLKEYKKGKIFNFSHSENKVVLGEGYDSVVLYDRDVNKFYTIVKSVQDNYSIEGGEGIKYVIRYDNGKFYADEYEITVNDNGTLSFNNLTLTAYTPYKMDKDGNIIGHRVKFIDSNTLTFIVPNLSQSPWTGEGYYDVSIVNPDTKSQTIRDGFYYFASSYTKPVIVDVVPDRGPHTGGNIIKIYGPEPNPNDENDQRVGFIDTGASKTKVFIGGQQVSNEDVTILPGGRQMEVKVPKTIENIKDMATDRITVPIVVVNPDGGTFSISYENPLQVGEKIIRGYTYLVPTSNPKINSIAPQKGSAGGGYILEIFGSDFRDFEPFVDLDGDGEYDEGEKFDDIDGNGEYTSRAPRDKETSKYNSNYEYLTSPLIPKVYFGNKEAEVVEFGTGYLQVIAPLSVEGTVDIYVMNNDSGISNKVKFKYEATKPVINTIVPSAGDFRGGTRIGIYGENLENNTLTLIKSNNQGGLTREVVNMPLIRFGDNTNENLPREDENSGVIRSNRATVKLNGGIEVIYDAANRILKATIEENNVKYTFTYEGYTGEEIFVNTKDFKYNNTAYPYEMLIGVAVNNNRLIVAANFAPSSQYYNKNQVTAITPVYFEIGKTPVFIINPDKGQGQGYFEFKYPDSNPSIVNITKDGGEGPVLEYRDEIDGQAKVLRVDYKGGNKVTIHGTDFREGAVIKIENILTIRDVGYNLPNQLTFTMPSVPESVVDTLMKVVVENIDGGTADSSMNTPPIYIEFVKGESNPQIYTVNPEVGPATGGTLVTITGNDFRNVMERYPNGSLKVYFGDKKIDNIQYIDYKTIKVTAPKSDIYGKVQVKVENPDGSITKDGVYFNYISKPKITAVSPNKIITNDTETEVTITGQMFMDGAKVVVGGSIINIKDIGKYTDIKGQGISGVDSSGNNKEVAVVGGMDAAEVKVESENVIKVKFNEVKDLENYSIIIINPDGGISDPYDNFQYEIPIPDKPMVLEGIPGYESTVKLIWSESSSDILNKASRYEVYGKLSKDKTYTFIGDTTEAEFLVKGLKPNTEYTFLVRALNEYGGAIEFATVKVKTLTALEDKKLKDKENNLDKEEEKLKKEGKEEFKNDTVIKVLGKDTIRKGLVDLSLSKYKDYNKFIISIPIEFIRASDNLMIKDGTLTLMLDLKDLYTLEVSKNDSGNKDAYVNIHINREGEYRIPRGKKIASKAYSIFYDYQYGKNNVAINTLVRPVRLTLERDNIAYPNAANPKLYMFNTAKGQYEEVGSTWANVKTSGKFILLSDS